MEKLAEDLYVYSTVAFVGKNASGKTTAVELLDCCYSILGEFRLENKLYSYDNVNLEIIFYHEGNIYKYVTTLENDQTSYNKAIFTNEHIYKKQYYKTKIKMIYEDNDFIELTNLGELPEDTSDVFFILKKKKISAVYFDSEGKGKGISTYELLFQALKNYNISSETLINIIQIFDSNIRKLEMKDDNNYEVEFTDNKYTVSDKELIHLLSSGTTKGILLYTIAVASLRGGFDLIIDEIENHFHKTLVENLISLYKDKMVNKKNATLYFSTHYCEILDLFNRQDNIWIAKSDNKVHLENMYTTYNIRPELLKSKQFYDNTFNTAVNYAELMNLKRKLMK